MDLPPLPHTIDVEPGEDVVDVMQRLHDAGVGDGHPVVPPTRERIERMLGDADGSERLGTLAPLNREVTVADVAVCAVLAGGRPEHLPVLVAAVRAVQAERFNLLGLTTTTGSAAVAVAVHGDAVGRVGANAGANCLGPGNVANAAIGRALAFVVRVVGGAVPGLIDVAITGQPAKYGLCFAELPGREGWPGLHEERGVATSPGAVTVFGIAGTVEVVDVTSREVTDLLDTLAGGLLLPVSTASDGHALGSGEPVVIVPPEWVDRLWAEGWTKRAVRQRLWERARVPIDRLTPGLAGRIDAAAVDSGELRVSAGPDDLTVLVAGGTGTKATLLPLWPGGTRSVTVAVPPG